MKEVWGTEQGGRRKITGAVAGCLATIGFVYLVAVFNVVRRPRWCRAAPPTCSQRSSLRAQVIRPPRTPPPPPPPQIAPWLGYSASGAFHLLALTASTFLGAGCYLCCVLVDPGRVPPGWAPDPEGEQPALVQVKRSGGGARFCAKCSAYKPPRAHHCRRCGRCVLRMDHHCVWTR